MIDKLQSGARQAVSVMEQSREKAQLAAEQTAITGDSLGSIVDAIDHINNLSAYIANASEQQGAVAEEINRNVSRIKDMSEQNAVGAQQTLIASSEQSRLATQLQAMVQRFKV